MPVSQQDFIMAEQLLRQLSQQINPADVPMNLISIYNDINQLRVLYRRLNKSKAFIKNDSKRKTVLSVVGAGIGYIKFNSEKYELIIQQFEKELIEAYFLSEKILADLRLIDRVQYTTVYNSRAGGVYHRYCGEDILKNNVNLVLLSDGTMRLRLNSREITKILKSQTTDRHIQQHYQEFIAPIYQHLRKSKTVSFNQGHAAEAFERHWEKLGHSLEPFTGNTADLGTEAERWALYIASRNNAPFYSGPDTLYSQVKRNNASLLSNIDTLLYTIQTILRLAAPGKFDKIAFENFRNILIGANQQKHIEENIKRVLGEGISTETDALIKEIQNILSANN